MKKVKHSNGISMPIVLVLVAIMLLLGITIIAVVNQDTKTIQSLGNSEQALHIAEAGYNRFLWLLNDDTYFYKYGENAEQGFLIESQYSASENPQWGGYTKTYKQAEYKIGDELLGYYQIKLIPPTIDNPVVGVQSTGWTKDERFQRTIYVEIYKRQFTNYVLFDDASGSSEIIRHGSVMKGPYFTNGNLYAQSGAEFKDTVNYVLNRVDQSGVIYAKEPVQSKRLQLPSANTELKEWASSANGGYTFEGDTAILLDNDKLKIRKSDGTLLKNISHPESGVIYVNGNLFLSGVLDGRLTILAEQDIYICAKDPTDNSIGSSQDNYNDPDVTNYGGVVYANDDVPKLPDKSLTNLSDDMLGLVTNNDIIIHAASSTWPRVDGSVKLITAQEDIYIHGALYCNTVKMQDVNWDGADWGAIITYIFRGLTMDQLHYLGSRTVKVNTSPGDYYRGYFLFWPIEIDWQYSSDNVFDYRLLHDQPPHFIEPVNSGWEVRSWKEIGGTP